MATRNPKAPKEPKASKVPKAPKPPKSPPPTTEAVAARLLTLFPPDALPALWKEADLKRRLAASERPLLPAALLRLQSEHQLLALTQGKTVVYLFAGPLHGWLAGAAVMPDAPTPVAPAGESTEDLFAVYRRVVRASGGFPDVKIAALRAALGPGSAGMVTARLVALWREGRATFSQGDWSLADESTRAAAVELVGERYLLVRLDDGAD